MRNFKAFFAFLCLFSLNAYADCYADVLQMRNQIIQWGSITTPSGTFRFWEVNSPAPTENILCLASAVPARCYPSCHKIHWIMGDWGNTFTCAE